MDTGRFKLEKETLAIGDANGKRAAVTIPAGDIVKLIADTSPGNGMVDVLWEGRTVAMYAIDLKLRVADALWLRVQKEAFEERTPLRIVTSQVPVTRECEATSMRRTPGKPNC